MLAPASSPLLPRCWALADLATFEVDCLEKNLRVKLKDGKQYNFADPGGDTDRLSSSTATWRRHGRSSAGH